MLRTARSKALGLAFLAVLAGAAWLWLHEQRKAFPAPVIQATLLTVETPTSTKTPSPTRRDADYWPQQPHPIAMRYRSLIPTQDFPAEPGLKPDQTVVWLVQ